MSQTDARARVARLFTIATLLQSRGPNECIGGATLADVNHCSTKTVQRDIEFLVEAGAPISYDYSQGTYSLRADSGWTYPIVHLTTLDILAFALMRAWFTRSPSAQSLPFATEVRTALAKTGSAFTPLQNELFEAACAATADINGLARDYSQSPTEVLFRACIDRQTLRILYESRSSGAGQPRQRTVEPYRIDRRDGQFLELHAWSPEHDSVRTFAVDRILEATPTGDTFEPRAWQSDDVGVVGGLRSSESVEVRVLFDSQTAPFARDKQWPFPASFEPDPAGSGGIAMTGTVQGIEGFVKEILRWGKHATVLGGPGLRQRVIDELDAMRENYL